MANITLTRIDSRLIHGQVIVKWSRIANGNRIVIVDDELEKDSFMVDIYQMAAPSGMSVEIYSTTRAAEEFKKDKMGEGKILNGICKVYLTVIRGTPMMVQLLIMWFVVWASARSTDSNMMKCAVLAFGINSGAYVAEIFRSGIMSIDKGQMEAGRSVGLTYATTMRYIIIPQAYKNVLPALGNELITLVKETSVVTVIGLRDLTKGAMIVQSKTYQALVPYVAIAAIYLVIVMFLTWVMGKMERRLRQSDLR